jgi:FSR family fosmidomycin resistance protein-like MFS transporter
MASGQIPSGWIARRLGGVTVLSLGTVLVAAGYGLAGVTGSLYGVIAGLLIAGLGGSTQHPIASTLVAHAYPGLRSRAALGTYNFTGDVGKVALPAVFAIVAVSLGWRHALIVTAAIAVVGAGLILATLQSAGMQSKDGKASNARGQDRPWAFWLLFFIHVADSAVRSGFLIFLPFLLQSKGADLPTIGLALSLLFVGGATGKLVMGWLGSRLGVVPSVVMTELATTLLIVAILPLPLIWALILLPPVGLMLNGTSSVLYGTIPEFVTADRRTHAFAVFYTGGSIAGAASPFLFVLLGDVIGLVPALGCVGALALLTVPMVVALRPAFRSTPDPSGAT